MHGAIAIRVKRATSALLQRPAGQRRMRSAPPSVRETGHARRLIANTHRTQTSSTHERRHGIRSIREVRGGSDVHPSVRCLLVRVPVWVQSPRRSPVFGPGLCVKVGAVVSIQVTRNAVNQNGARSHLLLLNQVRGTRVARCRRNNGKR